MRLRKKKRRPSVWRLLPLCLVLLTIWLSALAFREIKPAFWALAEMEARALTTEIIARAITEHIAKEPVLVAIERDAAGRVSLVQPNVRMINALSSGTALAIQQDMRDLRNVSIEIPLGLFSGSYLFSGMGPRLKARVLTAGAVTVDVTESFQSVGINQVRYVVLLKASTIVRVITPFEAQNIAIDTSYPVSEVVFSGEVPQVIFPFTK